MGDLSPWLWKTDLGVELSLLTASPRPISWHIKQTWSRMISQRVASKLQASGFDAPFGTVVFTCPRQSSNHVQWTL